MDGNSSMDENNIESSNMDVNHSASDLARKEQRRQRKKREQLQAYGILAACVIGSICIVVGAVFLVRGLINKGDNSQAALPSENVEAEDTSVNESGTDAEEVTDLEPSEPSVADQVQEAKDHEPEPETNIEERRAEALKIYVGSFIDSMTIEEKVSAMFFVTPESITGVANAIAAGSSTSQAISQYQVGGIVYDLKNMVDTEQFREMIYNTKSFGKYEMFIGVNDEGGEESALAKSGLRTDEVLSQPQIGATSGVAGAYSSGITMANTLSAFGININLAPVGDVMLTENSYTAGRSFGSTDVSDTASMTKNMIKGMNDQNMASCLKYFPGYGDVTASPDKGRAVSDRTKDDLIKNDYEVVKAAMEAEVQMIMVSHVSMSQVTGDNTPASLSSVFITDILRGELEYNGIIITDYLNKSAITKFYKHSDASVMAIKAGADMLLVPGDFKKAYNSVLAAVESGEITEDRIDESLYRIFSVKYRNSIDDDSLMSDEGAVGDEDSLEQGAQ